MAKFTIGVVGNPNCGKTTLFNELTGSKQRVGNWPGVTVERKTGYYTYQQQSVEVVDLPGTYGLDSIPGHTSADEEVAQQYILSGEADLIVNIIDATNLERNLYLTTQLLDMNLPILVAINMMDLAAEQQIEINLNELSQCLGVDVVPITAAKGQGIAELKQAINQLAAKVIKSRVKISYLPTIEQAITELESELKASLNSIQKEHSRWYAIKLLEYGQLNNINLNNILEQKATQLRLKLEATAAEEVDILIADGRYNFISNIMQTSVKQKLHNRYTLSDKIDKIILNKFLGIPIFLLAMYLMFVFTINLGDAFIDFFEILSGTIFVDGVAHLLTTLSLPEWSIVLLANGIGGGIQTIATFIPIIGFLFLFLSILEDSGYMSRAAFVMDRFMRGIGLPGKAFVPMIVGFGCNVPAVMATRTLESQRDRYLTMLMTPFMSCGARLPVYALFAVAFFPAMGHNLVFALYLIGIAAAVITGLIMKNTLFKGEPAYFIMELPAYHLPTPKNILIRTWDRLKSFIIRAGSIIIPMVMVISFLNSWGTDGTFGHDNSDKSVLSEIGRSITPAFEPMGITEENWPATVGIFTGILAKEVVVGSLNSMYSQLAEDYTADETEFNLLAGISEAFATIPQNLSSLTGAFLDPLGLGILDAQDKEEAAAEQEVSASIFGEMMTRFGGYAAAFAYLLFILMYFPCAAVIAAIYREAGLLWAAFVAFWTTYMGYMTAVIFYQLAVFMHNPIYSTLWIIGLLSGFALIILILYMRGHALDKREILATSELATR
jgi:ferrous iron transport protein B